MAGLWQVRLNGHIEPGTTLWSNEFGYASSLTVADEVNELLGHFQSDKLPSVLNILHTSAFVDSIDVIEMNDPTRFASFIYSSVVNGVRTGEIMPSFVAVGFKYGRAVRGQRSGAKRFGPISESDVDNAVVTSAYRTVLNACASALEEPITIGIIETWFPVILSKLPTVPTTWEGHSITGVSFQRITTQSSRKR